MSLGRRERLLKTGWRHGVTGIDNADSDNTSVFYKDQKKDRDYYQKEKDIVNGKRLTKLKVCFGTSSQVEISSPDQKRMTSLLNPKPETVNDIHETWKFKHNVPNSQSQLDTYKRAYVPASNVERKPEDGCMKKIRMERSLKLRKEDLRSKTTNIVTNNNEPEELWKNSFGA